MRGMRVVTVGMPRGAIRERMCACVHDEWRLKSWWVDCDVLQVMWAVKLHARPCVLASERVVRRRSVRVWQGSGHSVPTDTCRARCGLFSGRSVIRFSAACRILSWIGAAAAHGDAEPAQIFLTLLSVIDGW